MEKQATGKVATFRWQRRLHTIFTMVELGGHAGAYIGSSPLVSAWNTRFGDNNGIGVYAVSFVNLLWVMILPFVPRLKAWLDSLGVPRAMTLLRTAASVFCAAAWFLAGVATQSVSKHTHIYIYTYL